MRSIASWSLCPLFLYPRCLSLSLFLSLSISQLHSSNLRDSLIKILRDEKKGIRISFGWVGCWCMKLALQHRSKSVQIYFPSAVLFMLCYVYKYIKLSFLSIECLISSFYSWRFSVLRDKNFIKVQFFGQKRSKEFKICMNIFFDGKSDKFRL